MKKGGLSYCSYDCVNNKIIKDLRVRTKTANNDERNDESNLYRD